MAETQGTDRAKKTRERLLEAACQLFAAKGYQEATLREICEKAGANIAAANYHFGDKASLYLRAVEHAHREGLNGAREAEWPPGTPPERKLREFVRRLLSRMLDLRRAPCHRALMMREMANPTEATAHLVRESIAPEFQRLLGILDELLPPGTDPERRHLIAFSVIGQCLLYKVGSPVVSLLVPPEEYRGYRADRLASHIADFALAALGAAPPAHEQELAP